VRELYKYHVLGQAAAEAKQRELAAKSAAELLAGSQEAVQHVSKATLQELKALPKPPSGVDTVLECLLHLFVGMDEMEWMPSRRSFFQMSKNKRTWQVSQKLMSNPSKLMDRMLKFPDAIVAGEVPRRNVENARSIQLSMGYAFTSDAMRVKSVAAAGICSWLTNIIAFYDLSAPVRLEQSKKAAAGTGTSLQNAASPVGMLDKRDITELKDFKRPPHDAVVVCECLCILRPLGKEDPDAGWAGAKAMLSDPSLLKALLDFKVENVQEEQMTKVRELMAKEKNAFEPNSIMRTSKAMAGLVRWILSVVQHYEAAREFKQD
jgi:hypothetical protein